MIWLAPLVLLPAGRMEALDTALALMRDDRTDEARFVLGRVLEECPDNQRAKELWALIQHYEEERSPPRRASSFSRDEMHWFSRGSRRGR